MNKSLKSVLAIHTYLFAFADNIVASKTEPFPTKLLRRFLSPTAHRPKIQV